MNYWINWSGVHILSDTRTLTRYEKTPGKTYIVKRGWLSDTADMVAGKAKFAHVANDVNGFLVITWYVTT